MNITLANPYIAHRGAGALAPENTLAAYGEAFRLGASMIEVDAWRTTDGKLVIMHDDTVDRTTSGKGRVDSFSFAQIRALDAGSWFNSKFARAQVPTLSEVLQFAKGKDMKVDIHVREADNYPGLDKDVVAVIRQEQAEKDVLVTAFEPKFLHSVQKIAPELVTGTLLDTHPLLATVKKGVLLGLAAGVGLGLLVGGAVGVAGAVALTLAGLGIGREVALKNVRKVAAHTATPVLLPFWAQCDRRLVEQAQGRGQAVIPYVADAPLLAHWLLRQGAQALVTDNPEKFRAEMIAPATTPKVVLSGRVLHRGDSGWDEARINFCGRIDPKTVEPKTIVFVQKSEDVVNAVNWARDNQVPFRVRSGRHSYEAYSSVKDGLVIDVSDIKQIDYDKSTGLVTVGAGGRVMDIADRLSAEGRVLPMPTFPSVGISGATLGGGVGMASRKFGMTCDNLVSARVVTADGKIVTASQAENPDLLWALKGGGGGNFGVVTALTFRTHPVQNVAVFRVNWDWSKFDQLVDAWQKWAPKADDNLTPALRLSADRQISMYGQYTPDSDSDLDKVNEALAPLFQQVPPDKVELNFVSPHIASRVFGQVDPTCEDWRKSLRTHQLFKSTSAVADQPVPPEAIGKMRAALENAPTRDGENNPDHDMIQLLPGGGAASRLASGETGVYHRNAAYVLQYDAYWDKPEDADINTKWVETLRSDMLPYAKGAYVNYHDSLIKDPLVAYHGSNLVKLAEIKHKYDPDNVFNYPQSIPPHAVSRTASSGPGLRPLTWLLVECPVEKNSLSSGGAQRGSAQAYHGAMICALDVISNTGAIQPPWARAPR